jgi:repressor LexA
VKFLSANYSSLLSDLIDKSGLSLTEISNQAETLGQKITSSYLSKLKNGKMPPPSYKVSIVLAQVLNVEPELLIVAGMKDHNEANKEELENSLDEIYPDKKEVVLQKIKPSLFID